MQTIEAEQDIVTYEDKLMSSTGYNASSQGDHSGLNSANRPLSLDPQQRNNYFGKSAKMLEHEKLLEEQKKIEVMKLQGKYKENFDHGDDDLSNEMSKLLICTYL